MKETKNIILFLSALVIVLALVALASAQRSNNASLTGHVKDPRGASLPGATVTLYAREHDLKLTTTTDSSGTYQFEKLAPGEYLVEAKAQGFESAGAEQVIVERGKTASLDIGLELSRS